MQFNTRDFETRGERDPVKGSAAHTMYTSLREMNGVGESHSVNNFSDMLDKTREAYSSYNAKGEPERKGVQPYRVNVHSESSSGPELHRSRQGVEPLVAQSMINLHYRDPNFLKRDVPDMVRRSHQQHEAEQSRQETQRTAPMGIDTTPSQRGVQGVREAVSSLKRKRPDSGFSPDLRPTKRIKTGP